MSSSPSASGDVRACLDRFSTMEHVLRASIDSNMSVIEGFEDTGLVPLDLCVSEE